MDTARPPVPRRRLTACIHVSADSTVDLGVHLMQLATELLTDVDVPESVDRYTVTDGASGHVRVDVDTSVTAESYLAALRVWARETLATHPREDHRAAALDPMEPF